MNEGHTHENKVNNGFDSNKLLIGILAMFVVAIIVLITIIVAVNISIFNRKPIANDDAWAEADKSITEQAVDLKSTVEKLIQEDPVDVERINELYDVAIANAMKNNRPDYMVSLILHRNNMFVSRDLKQEALDALLAGDYSMLTDADLYRLYSKVIELAEALNNKEVLDKYQKLREGVADEYWADYNGTEASNEKTNIESQGAVRLNDWDPEDE